MNGREGTLRLADWLAAPMACTETQGRHGDLPRWQKALDDLPHLAVEHLALDQSCPSVSGPCSPTERQLIERALRALHPWRKGPFALHGVTIDSEWRSDWKWTRLASCIAPLAGRRVLDVGCGNGYSVWRMLGAGARQVVGIDPTWLFVMQFRAVRHFFGTQHPVDVLPCGIEDVPQNLACFDTVFSMGVLAHRRSAPQHLAELKGCLRPGGELVLETLVLADESGARILIPEGRYARMRNVWAVPTVPALVDWVEQAGFTRVRVVDVCRTTPQEQRATDWMRFQSLTDFLDPADPARTVEGYPAPTRAILLAERPGCRAIR